jgi:transcriptional regulator with XRE-family HTH domain
MLIQQRMAAEQWSTRDVEDQSAGLVGHSTVNNYANSKGAMPPKISVMQGLANGLRVPYSAVLAAVFQTLGGPVQSSDPLDQFTYLTSDDRDELLEQARMRNERRKARRKRTASN